MLIPASYLTIGSVLFWPCVVRAQACAPPARPYFEFQVERPAAFIADTTVSPRPVTVRSPRDAPRGTLVSFVVDTLGRPDSTTYRVIRDVEPGLAEEGRAVVGKWRYHPARVSGCVVPQLVQTPLERAAVRQ